MAREADKLKIGLFVIVSAVVFFALIVWLGATKFFKQYDYYVIYYDESISGLDIGSSVSFRGVPVGMVSLIEVAPDGRLIEVQIKIEAGHEVPDNYFAMLQLQGITGQRTINIDQIQRSQMLEQPELSFKPPLPVIKSYPFGSVQMDVALNRIYQLILEIDTKEISNRLVSVLASMDSMVKNSQVSDILAKMEKQTSRSLENLNDVLNKLERFNIEETNDRMITILEKYCDVADSIKSFIPHMTDALHDVRFLVQTTQRDLYLSLQHMTESMRSAKRLVDYLETNPSALIRGRRVEEPDERK